MDTCLVMADIVKVVRESEGFQCQICNFAWTPRVKNKLPRRCANPKCRSRRWDRERYPNVTPPPGGGDRLPVIGPLPLFPDRLDRRPPVHATHAKARSSHDATAA